MKSRARADKLRIIPEFEVEIRILVDGEIDRQQRGYIGSFVERTRSRVDICRTVIRVNRGSYRFV